MRATIFLTLLVVLLASCGKVKMPGVHRIPVQQGNFLEYDDVSQIQVGMSKADVQAILGTPVVGSLFNQSRWEYVYKLRTEQYGLFENLYTVYFEDDVVARIESDIKEPEKTEELPDPELIEKIDPEADALEKADSVLDQTPN